MGEYAKATVVSPERSRAEIESMLQRYGADQFLSGWDGNRATIAFRAKGRFVRFSLILPDRQEAQFTRRKIRGTTRAASAEQATKAWEQAVRQRWRALCLVIKAKLESVESGIECFEEAFLGQIVLPGNVTVAQELLPRIADAYETGTMPNLLPYTPKEGGGA